uniref:SKP1-like protein n=1 Tax=Oryza punctata TaxID=4537 RepID=A0A0E0LZ43_ORYPU
MAATPQATDGAGKMVTLISSDGARFDVPEAAARLSQTVLDGMKDDSCASNGIPLPNVPGDVLAKVVEYCTKHTSVVNSEANGGSAAVLKSFDDEFVLVDNHMLYGLLMAADGMRIQGLMDLTCQRVADMLKGKTPEQMRQTLGITNDFTLEEEEEIRREDDDPWLVLAEVIRYCTKHAAFSSYADDVKARHEEELKKFDREFIEVDNDTLWRLISAANVTGVEDLLDLACQRMLKGKTPEQMRQAFGIENI